MPSRSPEEIYRQSSLEGTGSLQRLIAVYTFAIEAAAQRDRDGVQRAIALLQNTLDFSADPSIALGLNRLYRQCNHHLASDDFGKAIEILEHLRALWKAKAKRSKGLTPAFSSA